MVMYGDILLKLKLPKRALAKYRNAISFAVNIDAASLEKQYALREKCSECFQMLGEHEAAMREVLLIPQQQRSVQALARLAQAATAAGAAMEAAQAYRALLKQCPVAVEAIPELASLAAAYGAIDTSAEDDEENAPAATTYAQAHGVPLPARGESTSSSGDVMHELYEALAAHTHYPQVMMRGGRERGLAVFSGLRFRDQTVGGGGGALELLALLLLVLGLAAARCREGTVHVSNVAVRARLWSPNASRFPRRLAATTSWRT